MDFPLDDPKEINFLSDLRINLCAILKTPNVEDYNFNAAKGEHTTPHVIRMLAPFKEIARK